MPHVAFERITAPPDSYPVVQDFLNQGFIETTRLLAELEGSPWFKVAIGIEFGGIDPDVSKFTSAEEAWSEILALSDFHVISSGAVDDSGGTSSADGVSQGVN